MPDLHVKRAPTGSRLLLFLFLPLLLAALPAAGQPTITVSADPWIGQAPLQVQLSATVTDMMGDASSLYSYSWFFGDGTPGQTGQSIGHTYAAPGTYTASVTATFSANPPGGGPESGRFNWINNTMLLGSTTVTVLPDYFWVAVTATPTQGNTPLTVAFTSTINAGGAAPFTYQWNFGDIFQGTSTAANPTYTYTQPGIYAAKVTVTDSKGWQSTGMVTVFASMWGLVVNCSATPTSGFAPLGVGLLATVSGGTGPYTITWNFGDGTTGTGAAPYHVYQNPGSYTSMVTVTDSTGKWTVAPGASVTAYPNMVGPPMP
jgi:PKD repeat protein